MRLVYAYTAPLKLAYFSHNFWINEIMTMQSETIVHTYCKLFILVKKATRITKRWFLPTPTRMSQRQLCNIHRFTGENFSQLPIRLSPRQSSGILIWEDILLPTPLDCLGDKVFSSQLLTNQETASKVQRKLSHSIVSETMCQIGQDSEEDFPDLNTIIQKGQAPDYLYPL